MAITFRSGAKSIRRRQFANVAARTGIVGGGAVGVGSVINSQRNKRYSGY